MKLCGKASAKEQYSAAVAALTAKAKLAGLWVDRAENLNGNYAISTSPFPSRNGRSSTSSIKLWRPQAGPQKALTDFPVDMPNGGVPDARPNVAGRTEG